MFITRPLNFQGTSHVSTDTFNIHYSLAGVSVRAHIELPFYTKYLLIAAYLASYNPAHTDRRFFTKQGKRSLSNRAKAAAKGKKSNTQLTGKRDKFHAGLRNRSGGANNIINFWLGQHIQIFLVWLTKMSSNLAYFVSSFIIGHLQQLVT